MKQIVVLSHGMGVETAAIFKRWVEDPSSRDFELEDLIVVTSQVGEEQPDTVHLMETYQLPDMRKHNIRFVELARAGHLEEDGIVVLQDTRSPTKLHPAGVYKLSDELLFAGTVPQFGGEHRCAMKFKAFVIESWMAYYFRDKQDVPVRHVFGYNSEETSRIDNSEKHIEIHNTDRGRCVSGYGGKAPIVVFGFNSEEVSRIERAKVYDGPHRTGAYPLQASDWNWDRAKCIAYLREQYGVLWMKSACGFCFSGDTEVITSEGVRWLQELVGKSPELLVPNVNGSFKTGEHGSRRFTTAGRWLPAAVSSFGSQQTYQLTLQRRRSVKYVVCTADHRWILEDNGIRTTSTLVPGDRLASCRATSVKCANHPVRPSAFAVAQGFTFGDGVRCKDPRYAGSVPFYGSKDLALLSYFHACVIKPHQLNDKTVPVALDIPRFWKDAPPLNESKSFLLGWLAGYFAADGDVNKKGNQATLWSAVKSHVEIARDVCYLLGVECSPITDKLREGFNGLATMYKMSIRIADLMDDFWIIPEHRRRVVSRNVAGQKPRGCWTVKGIVPRGIEPVFCATVPGVEAFTLADNLLTGNCPFNSEASKATPLGIERFRKHTKQSVDALLVEYVSLCMNHRGTLYRDRTLQSLLSKKNTPDIQKAFQERLDAMEWGLYRVRRMYTKKGKAARCVELVESGTRAKIDEAFRTIPDSGEMVGELHHDIVYLYFANREPDVYPAIEGFYVRAPKTMDTKVRGSIDKFNDRFEALQKVRV